MKPIEAAIRAKLIADLTPQHLEVTNESHMHSVPPGSESHFKVVMVSAAFINKRQVQRHQSIYAVLANELQQGVHALALHTYSPEEWAATGMVPDSPKCLGVGK